MPLSLVPVSAVSIPLVTRNDVPDISLRFPASCQPLPRRRNIPLANFGLSTTTDVVKTWVRSPEQFERLYFLIPGVIPFEPGCETTPSPMQCESVYFPPIVRPLESRR